MMVDRAMQVLLDLQAHRVLWDSVELREPQELQAEMARRESAALEDKRVTVVQEVNRANRVPLGERVVEVKEGSLGSKDLLDNRVPREE